MTVAAPRTKLLLGSEWTKNSWRVNLRESRYGAFDSQNNVVTSDQHYGAKWLTDLKVGYAVQQAGQRSLGR
ncbi:hypothetical protein [Caulobacter segnis]|uniref:TonB-dependent receptor-like beta-barrel domain-containing protein n=1 Tax=Caulobacter segnis TaxID=88688 RepID=A0A2W5V4Y1_9CAUL|nr:hypothetical protein [Caulobacter segnis]PZR34870.1 MAG: hypothetical protein DI526_08755 [Caulobacter segnis]